MPSIPAITRYIGDETATQIWWFVNGSLVNFSSGYTFSATLERTDDPTGTAIFTKTTGFTGAAGSGTESSGVPNLVITWSATADTELNKTVLTDGQHRFVIVATKTSDSSQETMEILYNLRTR